MSYVLLLYYKFFLTSGSKKKYPDRAGYISYAF